MAVFVSNHRVNDFGAWKEAFDAHESTREKFGIKSSYVLRSVEDANHVIVVGEGELEKLQEFLNSEDLKTAMEAAGVAGPPEIFIGENTK